MAEKNIEELNKDDLWNPMTKDVQSPESNKSPFFSTNPRITDEQDLADFIQQTRDGNVPLNNDTTLLVKNDPLNPYFLNSITPTEGNSGDVIFLEGKFPPQGQFQIVFGLHIIEPALYLEQRIQCIVPNGQPEQNVTVFMVFNNGEVSEVRHFHYKLQNDRPINILKVLNEEKGRRLKKPFKIESSNNQGPQSKQSRKNKRKKN